MATAFETDNLIYGKTSNPYDLARTAGGSSGGEAAIIASGGAAIGLGSEGAGSIRLPGHFCGIAGLKPSRGRLSLRGINLPFSGLGMVYPFGTFGPMARYVDDLNLMLPVLAANDQRCSNYINMPIEDINSVNYKQLRYCYYSNNGIISIQAAISSVLTNVANFLTNENCMLEEQTPPGIELSFDLLWDTFFLHGLGGKTLEEQHKQVATTKISGLRQQFTMQAKNSNLSLEQFYERIRSIAIFKQEFTDFMDDFDIVISPACATTAKPHSSTMDEIKDFSYTMTYNLLGWPAGVVRCVEDNNGLPIAVQVAAKPFQEHKVLAIMKVLESQFYGFKPPKI